MWDGICRHGIRFNTRPGRTSTFCGPAFLHPTPLPFPGPDSNSQFQPLSTTFPLRATGGPLPRSVAGGFRFSRVRPFEQEAALISVIIPVANEAETIGALVAAARAHPQVDEVIVVDDSSIDGT